MVEVKCGDFVCTRNPSPFLRWPINRVQAFWAMDGKSIYSHALRIIDDNATTFEAGIRIPGKQFHWIGSQNFFDAYRGSKVLIARHYAFDRDRFEKEFKVLYQQYNGRIYPYHRLILMAFPSLAKYLNIKDFGVCSEQVSLQLYKEGLMDFWKGVYPDYLADMAKRFTGWAVVFEGII